MLKVEKVSDYLRVTGYPDGSDWLVLPDDHRYAVGYGVVGPAHVWHCDRTGRLQLLHAPSRRSSAVLHLGEFFGISPSVPALASRDGQLLYLFRRISAEESALNVIDVSAGKIAAVHGGLPGALRGTPIERADSRLLLEEFGFGLILVDPSTGEWQESRVGESQSTPGFSSGSPDGRYWVRFDGATLPTRDTTASLMDRALGRKAPDRQYGITLQIWEAFPLQLRRRVVVAWLKADEMPSETRLPPSKRRAMWDAIAAAMAAVTAEPLGAPPPRSAYPPEAVSGEKAWRLIEMNLAALSQRWARVEGWQPDGEAFWVVTNGFLSCVGVDGTVSPRLYTERRGLQEGTWLPSASAFKQIVPLADRQARVIYADGEALFDGRASTALFGTFAVPVSRDQWRPLVSDDAAAREEAEARRRIAALDNERKWIVVPLAGWTEADCVNAIEALTAQMNDSLYQHAVDHTLRIVFAVNGEHIEESRFFSTVRARFPGAAPALKRLIERYIEVTEPSAFLFADEDGAGVLSRAVQALGVLDQSALPTLQRYGLLVDAEHEYFFAGETVPAVIAAHGWTDDVVDFVFWVLIRNYYNTLQDYGKIWREWGLRDAVVRREPRALARHLTSALSEIIKRDDDPGRYGPQGFEKLATDIPQPLEPWAVAFFEELERIFAESRNT